jgi:hypothetical protein
MKITVMKATIMMPSSPQAGDDSPRRNARGLTLEPVISTGMRARMVTMRMRMQMRRQIHHKPMMDQRKMLRNDLGPRDVDGYEGEDGDDVDADEEEEASQVDDGSTQNVEE